MLACVFAVWQVAGSGATTISQGGFRVDSGGATVTAGGLTVGTGGAKVTNGGLDVVALAATVSVGRYSDMQTVTFRVILRSQPSHAHTHTQLTH
jgi:hypothetical protein